MDLIQMGKNAQIAANQISQLSTVKKNQALQVMAEALLEHSDEILQANETDMNHATENGVESVMLDRLKLTRERIEAMSDGLLQIATLADPIGEEIKGWKTEDDLKISQVRVPIGVIGMIFEARPNVTVDAAGLTFKSGNAVILRGGKEALHSNVVLAGIMRKALSEHEFPKNAIQMVDDPSHDIANQLMQLTDYLDVLIPRGSAKFIKMVIQNAKVPVIETGAGNCHVYVDESADLQKAVDIVVNAKTQRPSVCNAMEKLVVNSAIASEFLPRVEKALNPYNVDLRGDERAVAILPNINSATDDDWGTEYNDYIMAIKVVDDIDSAIEHINKYNTKHSEAIITNNYQHSQQFTNQIDAAVVYVNASTRFTDGFKFGFGAEIGISTQKLHARGPMGLEALTSTKYIVNGDGQIRK
ncbi:glutamate-5-semialdehyde dehydrogenase [Pediococcus claussenii]|uniref:Gamma-glutamyl phosphate reductase n=1 Tax=Pediococcus claussenii (strain ATCC BAA-344 / DSM 14800 / JCM 18046 / KCTC 3811 / LMG 21948 / P06) TaxID=701521 RepID=G8PF10_PEDCP|nr:glutamate-5-semialdehyde dehydrogenase [Pediococcus claussenii ATCC BAA-344]ANZ69200.1 gamma-glutamyl-phosphate reductase [Pediococcus claussenii]ANZ71017.1 gamma-glutamyl-phosphate reductase [Pediococcus claussenii]KRN20078.1 proA protein [Pediococcus claussenii]